MRLRYVWLTMTLAFLCAHAAGSDLNDAIASLGTSSWRDAQNTLIAGGKDAIPVLIANLDNSGTAYNLGGHTKADAGRALRQRTIGEVCAELLSEIVLNHSNYSGDVPGLDKAAWTAWWAEKGASVSFATR